MHGMCLKIFIYDYYDYVVYWVECGSAVFNSYWLK